MLMVVARSLTPHSRILLGCVCGYRRQVHSLRTETARVSGRDHHLVPSIANVFCF